ncbi:MAG: hypothetical protein IJO43_05125 [Bacilli bacterium]|nr:hypothetical protein [Bacilli bacterium]
MYNFNLTEKEEVIEIFDRIWIKQNNNEKNTTIALTNKRLLFLEYSKDNPNEVLRTARGLEYPRYKEVYYQIPLDNIKKLNEEETYSITLVDSNSFEFDDSRLFELLKNTNI